jgi:hypothetical protein
MPKKNGRQKLRKLIGKIVIPALRKILGITLLALALLLPLTDIFTAAQVEASEQTEQVTLMQLEDLITLPGYTGQKFWPSRQKKVSTLSPGGFPIFCCSTFFCWLVSSCLSGGEDQSQKTKSLLRKMLTLKHQGRR